MPHLIRDIGRRIDCLRDFGAKYFAVALPQAMPRDLECALGHGEFSSPAPRVELPCL